MSDRTAAFAFGLHGESLAAWMLRLKGYRILARRSRHRVGEIDLIARRGNVLAFIEVKSRRDAAKAMEAITANQRRRIERAAEAFVQRTPGLAGCDWRFDVIVVGPGALGGWWPKHTADAWRPGS